MPISLLSTSNQLVTDYKHITFERMQQPFQMFGKVNERGAIMVAAIPAQYSLSGYLEVLIRYEVKIPPRANGQKQISHKFFWVKINRLSVS